jgi:hypothetical protein
MPIDYLKENDVQKLIVHRTLHVQPLFRYIRLEKEFQLSDKVVLQVPMCVYQREEHIDIENLVWDDDKQQYETHLPTLKIDLGVPLNDYLHCDLTNGWKIAFQDKDIKL